MDTSAQRKESNTPCILDRSHGLNEIAGCQVRNLRCETRYRLGQVVTSLGRSVLLIIAGLFLSVSAFSQTPGGPAGPYPTSDIEQPRRAYFPYSKFAGPPESVFRVEDRKIPSQGGSNPIWPYTPNNEWTGLPLWVFFQGDGYAAGSLGTYDVPLRAATNQCDCPVVSTGYRLAPENRYMAAPENPYAATRWMAGHTAEIDQNLRTPLSATPPGTFGLPPFPGLPQTPTSEANRAGGNIDLTTLAAHFRVGLRFRRIF